MFLIDMQKRKMWISTTGSAIEIYNDVRIDKILEYVSDIEMGLYLRNSFVKNLGKLKTCGEVVLSNSKIENLGELEECYEIELSHTPLTSLGNLRIIEGNADFTCSNVTDLGKLEKVGGKIYTCSSRTTSSSVSGNLTEKR